ncbi:MAG: S8 family serine peptidase, partial [Synergistaceae bacterium]
DGTDTTTAYDSDIMRGIDFVLAAKAAGANIRVVNMSFTGWSATNANEPKIEALSDKGIIVVIAAGNDFQDIDYPTGKLRGLKPYPACSRYANTIAVGAAGQKSDGTESRAEFSNYSSSGKWVDIFAPGDDILSTCRYKELINEGDNFDSTGYVKIGGTSMAAPMVSGTAALLCSMYPEKTATEIKAMILNGANPNILKSGYSAYGRIDAYNAAFNVTPEPLAGDGGGCAVGFAAAALFAALPLLIRRHRKGK